MIYIERKKKVDIGKSNFSINENEAKTDVYIGKTPKTWKYLDTPYGKVLKMPIGDYVSSNPNWEMIARNQSVNFNGYIFVIPIASNDGYRPIDFDGVDIQIGDYIISKGL